MNVIVNNWNKNICDLPAAVCVKKEGCMFEVVDCSCHCTVLLFLVDLTVHCKSLCIVLYRLKLVHALN